MKRKKTDLSVKIKQSLTEARVVLPRPQALLGFQFTILFTEAFEKLSQVNKVIHLCSLSTIATSMILLMAPAAYHRIVTEGEDTKEIHTFTSSMILISLVLLSVGLSSDLYVILSLVKISSTVSLIVSISLLIFSLAVWFGLSTVKRQKKK